eukprot:TRINITY_DN1682_c1_g4_i1.p1 TRINITY_DN1682_c1_g4~~TRINITY_DN1682_c1_g4_i1.p1  ORF type:complete len:200 (+),score=31.18 TRINITY_DN1682_c1_g4_i1:81-680(+)
MDATIQKKGWYFFRQRLKKRKLVQREIQLRAYQTSQQSEFFRLKLNSTSHSLSELLTQNSQLQNTITHFIQIQNLLSLQLSNCKNINQNLKSQVSLLHKQQIRQKSPLKRRKLENGNSSDEYYSIEDSEDSADEENSSNFISMVKQVNKPCAIKRILYYKQSIIPKEMHKIKKLIMDIPAGVCPNAMSNTPPPNVLTHY